MSQKVTLPVRRLRFKAMPTIPGAKVTQSNMLESSEQLSIFMHATVFGTVFEVVHRGASVKFWPTDVFEFEVNLDDLELAPSGIPLKTQERLDAANARTGKVTARVAELDAARRAGIEAEAKKVAKDAKKTGDKLVAAKDDLDTGGLD